MQTIFNGCPDLKRPRIRNGSLKFKPSQVQADQIPSPSNSDVTMSIVDETIDEIGALVESHMCNSEVVKSVTKMGFEDELVRATLRKALTQNKSTKFESCFQLVEAVIELESSSK